MPMGAHGLFIKGKVQRLPVLDAFVPLKQTANVGMNDRRDVSEPGYLNTEVLLGKILELVEDHRWLGSLQRVSSQIHGFSRTRLW